MDNQTILLQIPSTVAEDTRNYRSNVSKFTNGETSDIAFRAYRVPMGVYEQREAGRYMVRIRLGAGLVLPQQLKAIARLSREYGDGTLHITTRQDIQIHNVSIDNTSDIIEQLYQAGLSSRGGGGNTVRNVSACARAGVCCSEAFNVAPYAIATAEYLLQSRSSFNLPRKYKIAFSGCSTDCGLASIADLGFFAKVENGVKGFSVYVAGGLGSNPRVALKVEDFVKADEILEIAEAIRRLFDKYGDRSNKHKARLRYVLNRLGDQEFVKLYNEFRNEIKKSALEGDIPTVRQFSELKKQQNVKVATDKYAANIIADKTEGYYSFRLPLPLGDITAGDLEHVADVSARFSTGFVRASQLQDLIVTSIAADNMQGFVNELGSLSFDAEVKGVKKIVACTGASTCKLGLCLSRGLASAISDKVEGEGTEALDTIIRISGCPNSCGHHNIAKIGLQGRAKRVDGKLMPYYDVSGFADICENGAKLATKIGSVPAKRIPDMIAEVIDKGVTPEQLTSSVAKYSDIENCVIPEDYYYDYTASEPFDLAGRGPGECGAGVMDIIKFDIDEAKSAFKKASKQSDESERNGKYYKSIVLASRALLVIFGLEPKKDREIFKEFGNKLIEPGWVKPQTQDILENALDWRLGDGEAIEKIKDEIEDMVSRVDELFKSLDAGLKFQVEPLIVAKPENTVEISAKSVDLRGVSCPMNFVKAKLELEKVDIGGTLEVLLDRGEPIRNVPASFKDGGQEIEVIKDLGGYFCLRVKRIV